MVHRDSARSLLHRNGLDDRSRIRSIGNLFGSLLVLTTSVAHAGKPITFLGFDESKMSAEAKAGMDEIFSGRMFRSAMPVTAIELMAKFRKSPQEDLGYDPESAEGKYFSSGDLPAPDFRPAGMSLSKTVFERDGAKLTNGNCFSCHAGMVNGQVVAGLGNNRVLPGSRSRPKVGKQGMQMMLAALKSDAERKEFQNLMAAAAGSSLTLPEAPSRGDHFGPFAVWSVGARLADPANQGMLNSDEKTELVKLVESTMVPSVDPMPWWLMKYKKRGYWYSDSTPHSANDFSLNFTSVHPEVNETHAEHVASTAKALAFARETQSPIYPRSLDPRLVQQGADLFHGRVKPANRKGFISCKTCHGTYTKKESQPDLATPGSWNVNYSHSAKFRNVKTDPTYNEVLQSFRPVTEHINKVAIYFEAQGKPELAPQTSVPSKKGYIAPPLVGVWATAPYFHNGSVPTITAVLNSKERPAIWSRNTTDPHAYDLDLVGLVSAPLSENEFERSAQAAAGAPAKSKVSIDHRSIYDTRSYGHANTGHTFGDHLSDGERSAVIEFLKSLSGPDM